MGTSIVLTGLGDDSVSRFWGHASRATLPVAIELLAHSRAQANTSDPRCSSLCRVRPAPWACFAEEIGSFVGLHRHRQRPVSSVSGFEPLRSAQDGSTANDCAETTD
jgi:hypothetical protein